VKTNQLINGSFNNSLKGVAIIGMAGQFPDAANVAKFWQNLCDGVEAIAVFTDAELIASGVSLELLNHPNYVKAGAVLSEVARFDAQFFGYSPREAEIMDPQHRILLENAWQALEDAGYNPKATKVRTGVYVGSSISNYLLTNLLSNPKLVEGAGWATAIGNSRDFVSTRISYQLNLNGPSLSVNTACSTSLVTIHLACQGLLNYQCDMALGGGITVRIPQQVGYFYQEGEMTSPDGHCRPFDAKAQGTIFGSAVGLVVLKRLEDAIADGDHIYAVIKGSATNNDGSLKVGYTAPSVAGQAEVIAEAQALAGLDPETISYVEAHGTGTVLGDPIEIRALTQAFRGKTSKTGFCAIGSLKSNIGHVDAASGVAGLIKTTLALKHKQIPPTLHYEHPNPDIDFANSPFYVNTVLKDWECSVTPRRAGVSAFGMGGTNAHVVMEEAPELEPSSASRPYQLLVLSAKTNTALEIATQNLANHLKQFPELSLADVAYTLQVGRQAFDHRRMLVCNSLTEAGSILENKDSIYSQHQEFQNRGVNFLFTGQGSQYVKMAEGLYQQEPVFREQLELCSKILLPLIGLDLRDILYPSENDINEMTAKLQETAIAQPAIFAIAYALSQLWIAWGIKPKAMIGHSLGEYVAACIAGVFSLEDTLRLVAIRGKLMQALPKGKMLSLNLPELEIKPLLGKDLSLAAINANNLTVVSGTIEAIDRLELQLQKLGIDYRQLHTSHAFHSEMMEPMLETFKAELQQVNLKSPQIPYISNVTGDWITAAQATDPQYWVQHIRQTVRFADGLRTLLQDTESVLLEVGAGKTLSSLALRHPARDPEQIVLTSLRHPQEQKADLEVLLKSLGQLWLAGVAIDWDAFYEAERRYRLPLPTYPFERERFWIEPSTSTLVEASQSKPLKSSTSKLPDLADWFYVPCWKYAIKPVSVKSTPTTYLVFLDEIGFGSQLVDKLIQEGHIAIAVKAGAEFAQICDRSYMINPSQPDHYDRLVQSLQSLNHKPSRVLHLWAVTSAGARAQERYAIAKTQELGFYSLLYLAQSLARQGMTDSLQMQVISSNMQSVTGEEVLQPEKATLLGTCKVIPQEYPNIHCQSIDISIPELGSWQADKLMDALWQEITSLITESVVAYRSNRRQILTYEPMRLKSPPETSRLKTRGVYLITGGLGGIGLVLAEYLAKTFQARLVLVGRSVFPKREEWDNWLNAHEPENLVSQKIRKLLEIESFGAEVLVANADVTDLEMMTEVVSQAQNQFGNINGVIHTAGVAGGGIIQQKTALDADKVINPKLYGTIVLDRVLQNTTLDFLVLYSSMTSIVGGFGQVDYCAANAFLDAFAYAKLTQPSPFTTCINWGAWQEVGMAAQTEVPLYLKEARQEDLKQGILSSEGIETFNRILSNDFPQVLVSPQDLGVIFKPSEVEVSTSASTQIADKTLQVTRVLHPRPSQLNSTYVAPSNETERAIANIWQQVLGIEKVGIYDNFFDLGGDSLQGAQLIARLNQEFSTKIAAYNLYVAPTVSSISEIISPTQHEGDDAEKEPSRGNLRREKKMQRKRER
jgi:phthiocerol/phenolphthiocerol synthesis type-I polyketide synthase E